jgi:hypothetical protein
LIFKNRNAAPSELEQHEAAIALPAGLFLFQKMILPYSDQAVKLPLR